MRAGIALLSRGQLQLIVGPMFAGKTTEMIRRVKRFEHARLRCLLVKYSGDTRYNSSSGESGDDGQTYLATHDCASAATANYSGSTLMPLQASLNEVDVIGVDEGQFFPDLIQFCDLAANAGKVVVVAALDGTYTRRDFGQMGDLLACCDSITKLNAVCAICGEDAPFTRRDFFSEETKLIGGREKYTPVCRKHHTIPSDQEI